MHHREGELHVAIIMDGNGRWAQARGRPRIFGHRAGAKAVRRIVESARGDGLGIRTLTLYAFSADNWKRPMEEVGALMRLFRRYLLTETERCVENGIRLRVIGRRDRLPEPLRFAIETAERATAEGRELELRIAVDYSARDAIVRASRAVRYTLLPGEEEEARGEFARLLGEAIHEGENGCADVDLLIRTGGEQRLSDFLLWECAYAELLFTSRMWPEFDANDLRSAIGEFWGRERRFGRVPAAAAAG